MGNVYAQSVSNDGVDLIHHPFVVKPGHVPNPVRVVLAEAARVDGVATCDGKPCPAWIYAVPEQPQPRYFQPQRSDTSGRFQLQGLAPGTYSFFATDIELPVDVHDPEQLDFWRAKGTGVKLHSGTNASVALAVSVQR